MQPLENSIVITQINKNRITIWHNHCTSEYPQKWKHRLKYLYTHVKSSIIHNSQRVEATQVSTDGWMDKQQVVYTFPGEGNGNPLQYSCLGGNSYTCYNVDEPKNVKKDKYFMISLI